MNYFYFTVAVVVYCFTKCSLEKTRAAGKAREPTRPRHCRHKLDWQSEGWCEEKRKIWFFKRESVALKKSCVTLQSLLAWSSLALPLGNRLESGCNIVFTHGARRAKVARSLIDARCRVGYEGPVFRPYTQLRRSICTSELLRSSIRVSIIYTGASACVIRTPAGVN